MMPGLMTPQVGQMRRIKTKKDVYLSKALCRGRGPNEPVISKLPPQLREMLLAALKDAAEQNGQPINHLVWRLDRSGVIHVKDATIKVQ